LGKGKILKYERENTRPRGEKYFEELGKTLRKNPNALCTFVVVS
jgi:hypothetical protein